MKSFYSNSLLVQKSNLQISIVIPAFNEEKNIPRLYEELMKVLASSNISWEIVFSDDGSSDRTWEEIKLLRKRDSHIKGIRLSRNYGHQYALFAGLLQTEGDAIITMDADLQHPPSVIPKLVEQWENGNKIVHTDRSNPESISLFKRATSSLFYKIFSLLSGVKIQSGMADFRLLDRQVVDNILQFHEGGLFLRGIVQSLGYKSSKVSFQCQERFSGTTKYSLKKMAKFALDGITSFSLVPLRISIFVGLITSVASFVEMFYAFYIKLFTDKAVPGWASAVIIISFLFGVMFILLGIMGEYIGRILIEVKGRPRFLISEKVGITGNIKGD